MKKLIAMVAFLVISLLPVTRAAAETKLDKFLKLTDSKVNVELGGGRAFHPGSQYNWDGYKNSSVFTARIGYSPIKYVELQWERLQVMGFGWENKQYYAEISESIVSNTLNLKLKMPLEISSITLTPYIVAGIGRAHASDKYHLPLGDGDGERAGSGNMRKLGGGLEAKLYKGLYLFSEFGYWRMGIVTYKLYSDTPNRVWNKNSSNDFPYFSTAVGGLGLRF